MKTQRKSYLLAGYKFFPILIMFLLIPTAFMNDQNSSTLQVTSTVVGLQNNWGPDGWFLSGARPYNYKTGIDTVNAQHGHKSAYIESVSEKPEGYTTLMQMCSVKEYNGKRIKMTGYIKTQGVTDTASMWSRVDDFDKKTIADFDNMGDRLITGIRDWTKCEIVFDVPDSKCGISFGFIYYGTGKIWVDNVSFEIVSNSTGKTAFPLNQDIPEEMLSRIPDVLPEKALVNLDFED